MVDRRCRLMSYLPLWWRRAASKIIGFWNLKRFRALYDCFQLGKRLSVNGNPFVFSPPKRKIDSKRSFPRSRQFDFTWKNCLKNYKFFHVTAANRVIDGLFPRMVTSWPSYGGRCVVKKKNTKLSRNTTNQSDARSRPFGDRTRDRHDDDVRHGLSMAGVASTRAKCGTLVTFQWDPKIN